MEDESIAIDKLPYFGDQDEVVTVDVSDVIDESRQGDDQEYLSSLASQGPSKIHLESTSPRHSMLLVTQEIRDAGSFLQRPRNRGLAATPNPYIDQL